MNGFHDEWNGIEGENTYRLLNDVVAVHVFDAPRHVRLQFSDDMEAMGIIHDFQCFLYNATTVDMQTEGDGMFFDDLRHVLAVFLRTFLDQNLRPTTTVSRECAKRSDAGGRTCMI